MGCETCRKWTVLGTFLWGAGLDAGDARIHPQSGGEWRRRKKRLCLGSSDALRTQGFLPLALAAVEPPTHHRVFPLPTAGRIVNLQRYIFAWLPKLRPPEQVASVLLSKTPRSSLPKKTSTRKQGGTSKRPGRFRHCTMANRSLPRPSTSSWATGRTAGPRAKRCSLSSNMGWWSACRDPAGCRAPRFGERRQNSSQDMRMAA